MLVRGAIAVLGRVGSASAVEAIVYRRKRQDFQAGLGRLMTGVCEKTAAHDDGIYTGERRQKPLPPSRSNPCKASQRHSRECYTRKP